MYIYIYVYIYICIFIYLYIHISEVLDLFKVSLKHIVSTRSFSLSSPINGPHFLHGARAPHERGNPCGTRPCIMVWRSMSFRRLETWWIIPLSMWAITLAISGLSLLIPLVIEHITYLLSGMIHQEELESRFPGWDGIISSASFGDTCMEVC